MTAIDWPSFLVVLAAALVSAVVTVALFSVGVRLLAVPGRNVSPAQVDEVDGEDDPATPTRSRPTGATVGAVLVFAAGSAVAIGGVAMIVQH
jgi:hypothetical protein